MGCATWLAIILNATSSPTVSSPSIAALAPNSMIAAEESLLTNWIAFRPPAASIVVSKAVRT